MWTSPLLAYLVCGCIGALSRWAEPKGPSRGIIPPRLSGGKPRLPVDKPRPAALSRGRRGRAAGGGAGRPQAASWRRGWRGGDGGQRGPGRAGDALGVGQMARVLVRNYRLDTPTGRLQRQLRYVFDHSGEAF